MDIQAPRYDRRMPEPRGHYPHGGTLLAARKARGWSAERAARAVDVTRGTWSTWENGMWPRADNLIKIVSVFQVPPASVGLQPPDGFELVPAKWIRDKFDTIIDLLENRP
jgi:transcriptional regulator with XRE-family HTH domain